MLIRIRLVPYLPKISLRHIRESERGVNSNGTQNKAIRRTPIASTPKLFHFVP
jgi:hypothetical protein